MGNGILSKVVSKAVRTGSAGKIFCAAALAAAALVFPVQAMAASDPSPRDDSFSFGGRSQVPAVDTAAMLKQETVNKSDAPFFLDDAAPVAPAVEQPNIHGFAGITFTTAYLTPRGLLVFDKGVVIQPIVGLVLPIADLGPLKNYTWVAGIWNCITASQGDPGVGGWNEMDFFFSQSGTVADVVNLNLTYGAWFFPQSVPVGQKPKTEHNLDLKISYDDSKMWGNTGLSLNPYVDCWWAIAGSSTVVLGHQGGTGYFEFGVVPTYTVKAIPDYPIKITMPTYISTGPRSYWGKAPENFGVAYTALNLSIPLPFIPARYGHWHADAGVSYDYLINGALLDAGTILTGNTNRNLVEGNVGFGVNF